MRIRRYLLATCLLLSPTLAIADDPQPTARGLDIYFIDVQGGAATLVVTPERESILIDSGWPGFDDRDPKRIEYVLKEVAKLDHIDHLVTTHWHMDHYGGVAGLAARLRIDHFWDRGLPDLDRPDMAKFPDGPSKDDALAIAYRAASAGKRQVLKAGDKLPLKGRAVEAIVLAASGAVIDLPSAPENPRCADAPADKPVDKSDNARSIVLRFGLGQFHFLDCGDLTWNVEKQLVCPRDLIGPIDLYQVTHHGMDISNHPTLVQTIAPTVAVMNNGPNKGGAPATVKLLKDVPSIRAAYQLHKNAKTTAAENTAPGRIANKDASGGQFIHASVEPTGATFKVRIGEEGEFQVFPTRTPVGLPPR